MINNYFNIWQQSLQREIDLRYRLQFAQRALPRLIRKRFLHQWKYALQQYQQSIQQLQLSVQIKIKKIKIKHVVKYWYQHVLQLSTIKRKQLSLLHRIQTHHMKQMIILWHQSSSKNNYLRIELKRFSILHIKRCISKYWYRWKNSQSYSLGLSLLEFSQQKLYQKYIFRSWKQYNQHYQQLLILLPIAQNFYNTRQQRQCKRYINRWYQTAQLHKSYCLTIAQHSLTAAEFRRQSICKLTVKAWKHITYNKLQQK